MVVHLLKNPKLVFAAVLLGFQVQLLSAPTFSSGHGEGAKIRQQPQEESEAVEVMNPEKQLQLERQFEEELEKAIDDIKAEMNEQLLIYQKELDDIFKSQVEQAEKYQKGFKADIDALLKKAQADAGKVEATARQVKTNAEKVKATAEKVKTNAEKVKATAGQVKTNAEKVEANAEKVKKTLTKTQKDVEKVKKEVEEQVKVALNKVNAAKDETNKATKAVNERADEIFIKYKDLESKFFETQGQIQAIAVFGSVAAVLTTILLSPIVSKILKLIEFSPVTPRKSSKPKN